MPTPESEAFDLADEAYKADQSAKQDVDELWDKAVEKLSQTEVAKNVATDAGAPGTAPAAPAKPPVAPAASAAGEGAAPEGGEDTTYAGTDVSDITPAQKIMKSLSAFGILPGSKEREEHPIGSALSEGALAVDPLGSAIGTGIKKATTMVGNALLPGHEQAVDIAGDLASLASGRVQGAGEAGAQAMGIMEKEGPEAERAAVQGGFLEKAKAAVAGLEQKLTSKVAKAPMTHAEMVKAAGGVDPDEFAGAVLEHGHALSADQHIALSNAITQLGQHISDAATDLIKRATDRGIKPEDIPPEDSAHVFQMHTEFARLHALEQKASEVGGQSLNAQVLTKAAREAHAETSAAIAENLQDPMVRGSLLRGFASLSHPAQVAKFASDTAREMTGSTGPVSGLFNRVATYLQNAALWNPGLIVKKVALDNFSMFEQPALYAIQGKMHDFMPGLVDAPTGDAAQAAHDMYGRIALQHFAEQMKLNYSAWKSKIPHMITDSGHVNTLGSEDDRFINETGGGLAAHYSGFMAAGRRMAMALTAGPYAQMSRFALHARARLEASAKAEAQFALEKKTGIPSVDAARRGTIEEELYQRLINRAPQRLQKAADRDAQHVLYLNDPNAFGKSIEGLRSQAGPLGKIGCRFFRVPFNIGANEYAHSPLGFAGLLPGRLHNSSNVAKATLGLGSVGLMAEAHAHGIVTGYGPHDPKERAIWLQTNRPYSFNIAGHHIGYDALPLPFRKAMMMTADYLDVHGQLSDDDARQLGGHVGGLWQRLLGGGERAGEAASVAVARSVVNDPYLNWLDMWSKLHDYSTGNRTAAQVKGDIESHIASVATPSIIKSARYASDDYQRNVQGMVDAVKNQFPMTSRTLPAERDEFGNPKHVGGGYSGDESPSTLGKLWNFMMPAKVTNLPMNPPTYEIQAQQLYGKGYKDVASKPSRSVGWWSPEDKDTLDIRAGMIKHEQYDKLTTGKNADWWNSLDDRQKARRLMHMNAAANLKAIKSMHHDNPNLKMQDKMMRKYHKVFRTGAEPIGVNTP